MTDPAQAPSLVPGWLERLGAVGWRLLAAVALAVVVLLVAIALSTVTATIVVALLVVFAILPVYRRVRARGASSPAAAAYASGLAALVGVLALLLLVVAVLPHLAMVASAVRDGMTDLRAAIADTGWPAWAVDAADTALDAVSDALRLDVTSLVPPIANGATVAILAAFLTYFLLADGAAGWAWAMRALKPWQATAVTESAADGLARVSGYLGRTLILATVDGIVVFAVLVAFGIGIAGPLAVIAFVGGFIPFLGAIVATAVISLAALALAGPWAAIAVIVAVVATSIVAGRLLAGTAFGRGVDVSALVVIIAIPAGLALFGALGLVALLPTVVFVTAVSKSIILVLGLGPEGGPEQFVAPGVPVWLDRLGQWSWRGLVVIALVWVFVELVILLPYVAIPIVLAGVLAATLSPVASRLRRLGWSAGLASATTTITAVVATVIAVAASIAFSVGPLREIVATAIEGAGATGVELVEGVVRAIGQGLLRDIAEALRGIIGVLVILGLTLLLTFFLMRDAGRLWQRGLERIAPQRRARVERIGTESVDILSGYMVGTAIISAFGAVTTAVILVLLGLPLALPIAVFAFAAGFIPYVGSFLSTALSTLVAVAVGEPIDVVVMLIWTVVFNIVQGNFVTPLVYGRTMSLHPAIILLAIPAGGQIAGILGMFLIVPFIAIFGAVLGPVLDLIDDADTPTDEASPSAPSAAGPEAA